MCSDVPCCALPSRSGLTSCNPQYNIHIVSKERPKYIAVNLRVQSILAECRGSTNFIVQGLTLSEGRTSFDQPGCTRVDEVHHTNDSSRYCLNEVQRVLE